MGSDVQKRGLSFKIYVSSKTHTYTHTHTHTHTHRVGSWHAGDRRQKYALFANSGNCDILYFKDIEVINMRERWVLLSLRTSEFCKGNLTIL